jgi:hypothetical protein
VVVTGETRNTPPETSTVLAKIIVKDELPIKNKGKANLEFQPFEDQDVDSLHQTFLTRLSESRDSEVAMINSLKRKYEVNLTPPSLTCIHVASKS